MLKQLTTRELLHELADRIADKLEGTPHVLRPELQVGNLLRAARTARGWTAERAAKEAGVAQKTYARVEDGEKVRSASLCGISKAFGLPQSGVV